MIVGIFKTRKKAVKWEHFPDVRKMLYGCKLFVSILLQKYFDGKSMEKTGKTESFS